MCQISLSLSPSLPPDYHRRSDSARVPQIGPSPADMRGMWYPRTLALLALCIRIGLAALHVYALDWLAELGDGSANLIDPGRTF